MVKRIAGIVAAVAALLLIPGVARGAGLQFNDTLADQVIEGRDIK